MRTAILLSAILIAASINSDYVDANTNILSIGIAIFIGIDVFDFILKHKIDE